MAQNEPLPETYVCATVTTYERGRPKFDIPIQQIKGLRAIGFTWIAISKILNIRERTLRRRRAELGMSTDDFASISNQEIDVIVTNILNRSPNSGERMVRGAIQSRGLRIQRRHLRESLLRVDPVSRALRRMRCIKRRIYNVKAPNSLR